MYKTTWIVIYGLGLKKGHLSGNRNGEGQHQQTAKKCYQSQTQPTTNIEPLKTKIKTYYIYRFIPYRAVDAPLPVIKTPLMFTVKESLFVLSVTLMCKLLCVARS